MSRRTAPVGRPIVSEVVEVDGVRWRVLAVEHHLSAGSFSVLVEARGRPAQWVCWFRWCQWVRG